MAIFASPNGAACTARNSDEIRQNKNIQALHFLLSVLGTGRSDELFYHGFAGDHARTAVFALGHRPVAVGQTAVDTEDVVVADDR